MAYTIFQSWFIAHMCLEAIINEKKSQSSKGFLEISRNMRPGLQTNSDVIDIINFVIKLVGVDFLLLKIKFCDKYIYQ